MPGITERTRALKDEMAREHAKMKPIMDKYDRGEDLNSEDRATFDAAEKRMKEIETDLKVSMHGAFDGIGRAGGMPSGRSVYRDAFAQTVEVPEIQGEKCEPLTRGQSMVEYVKRAADNGVHTVTEDFGFNSGPKPLQWRDNDYMNAYWGFRLGLGGLESRALAEDTSGSGLAITPQAWTAQVIDYLYANAVAGALNVTRVPLPTEIYNYPVFTAPVQPAWLAENASIGLDANPAFSTIQFNAKGGFKDITNFSVELAQDAYIQGTLPDFLAQSVARNMALAVDAAMINGVSGNTGNPGLNGETNFVFRHYTSDAGTTGIVPPDTSELSRILQAAKNVNSTVTAYLSNPTVEGTFSRLTAGSYPMWWPRTADTADIPFVTTANANVVPATETDPATASTVALTGGSYSSVYAGFWPFVMLGVHLDLQTRPLVERYADLGQVGLFSFMRFSIRTAHPETFTRTIGVKAN